jgi:hypothetical protein
MTDSTTEKQKTETTTAPDWASNQLSDIATNAQNLYYSGKGFDAYPESRVTPFSSQTLGALGSAEAYAQGGKGVGLLSQGQDYTSGVLAGTGNDPTSRAAFSALRQGAEGSSPWTAGIMPYATGQYVNGGSPAFRETLNYGANKIADKIDQNASAMGRFGTNAAHEGGLADAMGNYYNTGFTNELSREQGLQLQAAALGQNAATNNAQAALQAQQGAAGSTAGQYQAGLLPSQTLAGVGSTIENKDQQYIQDAYDAWNTNQQKDYNRLAAYQSTIAGLNPQAYTSKTGTETSTTPFNATSLIPLAFMGGTGGFGTSLAGGLLSGAGNIFKPTATA